VVGNVVGTDHDRTAIAVLKQGGKANARPASPLSLRGVPRCPATRSSGVYIPASA
jgi:hypothetical protein